MTQSLVMPPHQEIRDNKSTTSKEHNNSVAVLRPSDGYNPVSQHPLEEEEDVVDTSIPLPRKNPPTAPVLPRIALRLLEEGIISSTVYETFRGTLASSGTRAAALPLLQAWHSAHVEGKRVRGAERVFQPDATLGLQPSSFNPDWLRVMAGGEQTEVINFLVTGFTVGFTLGPRGRAIAFEPVEFHNRPIVDPAEIDALREGTRREASKGCIGTPNWPDSFVSPIFGVPKKKDGRLVGEFRQAHHLSKGNKNHLAVNEHISRQDAEITFESVQTAIDHVFRLRNEYGAARNPLEREPAAPDIRGTVLDAERAFRIMPLHPSVYPLLCFRDLDGNLWFESRLPFGLRNAPRMYSSLSNTIQWLLQHVFGIDAVVCYIDDFLIISIGVEASKEATAIAKLVFAILGVATQPSKKQPEDSVEVTFLGAMLNFATGHKQIPPVRLGLLIETLASWRAKTHASLREIQSLCGTLCHAARVIEIDRLFLTRLWRKIRFLDCNPSLRTIELGKDFALDIKWWLAFLSHHNGVATMKPSWATIETNEDVSTDACGYQAAGVDSQKKYFWSYNFVQEQSEYASRIIAVKEAWALPVMAMMPEAGPTWRGKIVLMRCDNTGVVHSVRSGHSRNADVSHLLRVLHYIGALYDFKIVIVYVRSEDNIADIPSRDSVSDVLQDQTCSSYGRFQAVAWVPPPPDHPTWEDQIREHIQACLAPKD